MFPMTRLLHNKNSIYLIFIYIIATSWQCSSGKVAQSSQGGPDSEWKTYWYQGKAECNTFRVQQSRYGAIRDGEATLIFVTEDLHPNTHVKLDQPEHAGNAKIPVLKMNRNLDFFTGIYPYHLMTSVFTPVAENSKTVKIVQSVTEWCGQAYMQCDVKGGGVELQWFSYFEQDSSGSKSLPGSVIYEDAVWTTLRLHPSRLPIGTFQALPGCAYLRLKHVRPQAYTVHCTLLDNIQKGGGEYVMQYPELQRELRIRFSKTFPFLIEGWEESYPDGAQGAIMTSKGVRTATKKYAYWQLHDKEHAAYRDSLQLRMQLKSLNEK